MSSSFFEELNVPTDDSAFYSRVYSAISRKLKEEKNPLKKIVLEEFDSLSLRLDKSLLQESPSVRSNIRTRMLADLLITDEGELNLSSVAQAVTFLKENAYSLGPERQYDTPRQLHLLKALQTLEKDKEIQRELKLISKPYSHKVADQIIRDTLRLAPNIPLTDAHARKAVLSAWFNYLRQNVGSCFATAPAIMVQNEQPVTFFKDMQVLLATGRIKRTFAGNEYVVPLSLTWGVGDFKKHIMIQKEEDLSFSPGLLHALEAVHLIDPKLSLKEKIQLLRKWIKEVNLGPILSAEEILQKILMKVHKITPQDLHDFENRPRGLVQTSLLMSVPIASSKMGGKGEACSLYLTQMNLAKIAFNLLTENPLLKVWEFTLASFAETKPGFTRWNMYASLGFNTEQKGGIGDQLYQEVKRRLDHSNQKVHDIQSEYEMLYSQLKFIEGRMRSASSEKEAQWIRVEYESKRNEFHTLEEIRNKEHFKAGRFANLLNDLLEKYDELFPRYFQEVYDADMHEVLSGPYDDSPAGFRLLYKHGRENTSQWSLIYSPQDFIEYLSSFFVATEPELVNDPLFEGLQEDISAIITAIVSHVKTDEFLISSFYRMAEAHNAPLIKNPLEHLDRIEKKPWAYTSGGTMHNLMSCYFKLEEKPKEVERWVENELELLVFFIDAIKQIPPLVSEKYLASPELSLLMHSPTHAFTFRPGLPLLKKAVEAEGFTYTWARDYLVKPAETYIEFLFLDQEMMGFLLEKFSQMVPEKHQGRFQSLTADCYGRKNPREFRRFIIDALDKDHLLQLEGRAILEAEQIDSALFNWLPLTSRYEVKNRAEKLIEKLPGLSKEHLSQISDLIDEMITRWEKAPFLTAQELQNICKAALCIALQSTSVKYDYPYLISLAAQDLSYAMPTPVIFADTNWVKDWFAFLVNPGTGNLELWRVDPLGRVGFPMTQWKKWLNGSDRSRTWGIFTKPQEYS